jgi:hypothetical protein
LSAEKETRKVKEILIGISVRRDILNVKIEIEARDWSCIGEMDRSDAN